ncbi:hypothetical protein RMCBS344292_02975 [Rhizopus microsporus]|nr:hypothetical protein RMCBS344292_02975 [Rhizopus microsporus]
MREKKRQIVVYDPGKTMINRPASWKRSASEELTGSSSKRARRTPEREEYLMNTLEQLEIHASSEIRHCYQTGGNLGELRKSMLSRSRLPRWIVTGAEARINVKRAEISRVNLSPATTDSDDEVIMDNVAGTNPAATQIVLTLDDDDVQESTDITRRKMNKLRTITRQIIFKQFGHIITERHLKNALPDIQSNELQGCVMIANFLMLCPPAMTDLHSVAQQLPFFLMASDLFQCIGYTKFIEKLVPMTSPTRLLALQINVPQIYSLFSSSMDIHDFNDDVITSRQIATESKDSVFSSFFGIDKINSLCASYDLKLAHNTHALPEVKTVRINGYLRNQTPSRTATPLSHTRSIKRNYEAFEREMPDRRMIQQAEVDTLQRQLKKINFERREFMLKNSIRDLKKQWIRSTDRRLIVADIEQGNRLYQKIQQTKASRDTINERLINTKQQFNNNQLSRVENFKLDDTQSNLTNLAFSGTDNGLVTMTETAKLSLDQFKFHLKLYNRYSALTEDTVRSQASAEEATFFKFAKPFKVHASEIAYGSGAIKLRAKLQRAKKIKAKVISEIEAKLSEYSFQEIRSVGELNNWYNGRVTHQDVLRDSYYSQQRVRQLRTYELQKRKYIDRLCSQERSYVTSSSKKPSIMFI